MNLQTCYFGAARTPSKTVKTCWCYIEHEWGNFQGTCKQSLQIYNHCIWTLGKLCSGSDKSDISTTNTYQGEKMLNSRCEDSETIAAAIAQNLQYLLMSIGAPLQSLDSEPYPTQQLPSLCLSEQKHRWSNSCIMPTSYTFQGCPVRSVVSRACVPHHSLSQTFQWLSHSRAGWCTLLQNTSSLEWRHRMQTSLRRF